MGSSITFLVLLAWLLLSISIAVQVFGLSSLLLVYLQGHLVWSWWWAGMDYHRMVICRLGSSLNQPSSFDAWFGCFGMSLEKDFSQIHSLLDLWPYFTIVKLCGSRETDSPLLWMVKHGLTSFKFHVFFVVLGNVPPFYLINFPLLLGWGLLNSMEWI